jgi:dUTP pyrophosphatase
MNKDLGKSMRPVITDETAVYKRRRKMVNVNFNGPQPVKGSDLASGFDLKATDNTRIYPGETKLVHTDLKIAVPKGYEAQVRSRSGLAFKNSIFVLNAPGTIDADYRGEVGVIIHNAGKDSFRIKPGDRIAQLVICPVCHDVEWSEVENLDDTDRGEDGFGSTGVSEDMVECHECDKIVPKSELKIHSGSAMCQECYDRNQD